MRPKHNWSENAKLLAEAVAADLADAGAILALVDELMACGYDPPRAHRESRIIWSAALSAAQIARASSLIYSDDSPGMAARELIRRGAEVGLAWHGPVVILAGCGSPKLRDHPAARGVPSEYWPRLYLHPVTDGYDSDPSDEPDVIEVGAGWVCVSIGDPLGDPFGASGALDYRPRGIEKIVSAGRGGPSYLIV